MNKLRILFILISAIPLLACSPKIYVIDHQTVLEEEAAGQWPEFESDLLKNTAESHPTPFPSVPINKHSARLYNILNNEFINLK